MRKSIFLVLLSLVALAPAASAQTQRGYYDQYGRYHEYSQNDGYYDSTGQWHPRDYDRDGNREGYYDSRGVWHETDGRSYEGYRRVTGPNRWTWSDSHGRTLSLATEARDFALTVSNLDREASRRSGYSDRAALEALRRLDVRAENFARVTRQGNHGTIAGQAYAELVDSYFAARNRFGPLASDRRLSNQFYNVSAVLGRLDKRFFGSRAFGGQSPDQVEYRYENDRYGYDRYGNRLPGYDRDGRDSRPYPY